MSAVEQRFRKPVLTTNIVADITEWVREKSVVIVHNSNENALVFHECVRKQEDKKNAAGPSLDRTRVILLDVVHNPALLVGDELSDFLRGPGVVQCTCAFKKLVIGKPIKGPYLYRCTL